ncbi:MAG: hypothetical protein A3I44_01405 [Candidatus Sungbacteria bacterium RIFCSPLOWO2_02_FULL_51_17]|uniref:DUF4367 domain-containing protein n=1 Tax=Candidatus Sungbacteria bacterium RIFCSPHIGHO2_02_FULL_51_29 TaxID=1802273 RepID=A0A1G2KYG7_9BACT|nr:MAG: hypothetical protein A3C16_00450 [Candidatus Sungbacteria bacterium RIFCSPHIGHO2_02_FULL_51_29]OHA06243.1 MAG: hypothetical protein A3B29_02420 [Candidatus Sungbacteria bacterium RIFCSPLOWO2_01_FULL_51_34]OHA10774.1 MAG: hypothetical protein A3I44_01405 [Candidatus Sungbacteria bacterium RIFCSPLOWO2_02_FULL_51_17]
MFLVTDQKTAEGEPVTFFQFLTNSGTTPSVPGDAPPPPPDEKKATYDHPLGFSFQHPTDVNITSFDDGEGEVVLGQGKERRAFQIFILPFDEEGPVTPERVKKDVPDMQIESPQQVLIGKNKNIAALIFLSESQELGKTREIWFSHEGYLYQITTYADADSFIGSLLETWRFEEQYQA